MTALLRAPLALFVIHTSCIALPSALLFFHVDMGKPDMQKMALTSLFNANEGKT